jgi:hypothetical protein
MGEIIVWKRYGTLESIDSRQCLQQHPVECADKTWRDQAPESVVALPVRTNSHQNSLQTILASPIQRGQFRLNCLFCWCREGGSNPHEVALGGF